MATTALGMVPLVARFEGKGERNPDAAGHRRPCDHRLHQPRRPGAGPAGRHRQHPGRGRHTGRDAIGIEYEPGWATLAEANLKLAAPQGATGHGMILQADATRLPDFIPPVIRGRVALVLTSPPYGRTMHGRVEHRRGPLIKFANRYGEPDPANLAHRGLAGIRDGLATVLAGCLPLLRPGGVVVITARPWRRNGVLVDLPCAVTHAAIAAGLTPRERCVALLAAGCDGHLVPRHTFFQLSVVRKARARGFPQHLIAHEDIHVFAAGGV